MDRNTMLIVEANEISADLQKEYVRRSRSVPSDMWRWVRIQQQDEVILRILYP